MALLNRSARAGWDANSAIKAPQITKNCGEDIDTCAPCYVGADDLLYMSNGTAANTAAHVDGFSASSAKLGERLTIYGPGLIIKYAPGELTPGDDYFVAGTKGRLDTEATVGDDVGVARAIDTDHIRVLRFK
ncbi:MAG TPA: hypothetical protein VFR37_10740 [Longimicrobium sp.]|nr:hypothetical protein [Longimicrobium sp.]